LAGSSGKTTLINAGLKSPDLAKTVVVVNEFGEVGQDHQLYTSSNDAVVVLENGCLCCTVRTDLIATMSSLYHDRARGDLPDFNNVVIETTGLAEPGPVLQAFLSEPTLDGLYRVFNVVTVVDAVNWEATAQNHNEAQRQVALADDVLITRLDMKGDGTYAELSAQLQSINPAAKILWRAGNCNSCLMASAKIRAPVCCASKAWSTFWKNPESPLLCRAFNTFCTI
jgi:G3E family GTPase